MKHKALGKGWHRWRLEEDAVDGLVGDVVLFVQRAGSELVEDSGIQLARNANSRGRVQA